MPDMAMGLEFMLITEATFSCSIHRVISKGADEHVVWIYAKTVIAVMTYDESGRHQPVF